MSMSLKEDIKITHGPTWRRSAEVPGQHRVGHSCSPHLVCLFVAVHARLLTLRLLWRAHAAIVSKI